MNIYIVLRTGDPTFGPSIIGVGLSMQSAIQIANREAGCIVDFTPSDTDADGYADGYGGHDLFQIIRQTAV